MDCSEKTHGSELGFREYVEALEVEREKIQVFRRELPLCLELVTQTIERCKQQISSGAATTTEYLHGHQSEECNSGQMSSEEERHVFEEFIPLKRSCSSGANNINNNEDDEEEYESPAAKSAVVDSSTNTKKQDWLRSVQLWNDPSSDPPQQEESEKKTTLTEVRKNGGAFQPFQREKNSPAAPASDPAASSSADAANGKREAKEGQRKQRRNWSPELHKRFLNALQQLGGSHAATPKQIRELMKVDGLTNDEVKSHLQKYRLHTRRPAQTIPNNGATQTPQVVFVGGIWVQPSDYAAAAAAAASGSGDHSAGPVYAPVATAAARPAIHNGTTVHRPHHRRALPESGSQSSEERASQRSNSPSTSSSTHTTTNSHAF